MNPYVIVALAAIACKSGCEIALLVAARRRARELQAGPVPEEAAAAFPIDADFRKAMAYSSEKSRDGIVAEITGFAVTAGLLLGGAALLRNAFGEAGSAWSEALVVFGFFTITGLADIPAELWGTFRTEAKFGFNKTTPKLWIIDRMKGLFVGFLIVVPLLAAGAWFLKMFPKSWWIFAWAAFSVFQILAAGLLTVVLLPLFNKLTPLAEGPLKERLLALARRAGFAASAVLVMDGSKRSSHANAFFAGFGRMRRIVLFDTLVEQLEDRELEAVLAHEIGHWKRGHILKAMALGVFGSLPVFALAGYVSTRPDILADFGFVHTGFATPVILLALTLPAVLYWLSPLTNGLSRMNEFEADAYASEITGGPAALVGALRKLYAANSGNPLPHPAYALFHHSHPTLPERERALGH